MAAVLSEGVPDPNGPKWSRNDHFGQNDLIPNRILAFAGPFWPKEVYFGPFKSANHALANLDQLLSDLRAPRIAIANDGNFLLEMSPSPAKLQCFSPRKIAKRTAINSSCNCRRIATWCTQFQTLSLHLRSWPASAISRAALATASSPSTFGN